MQLKEISGNLGDLQPGRGGSKRGVNDRVVAQTRKRQIAGIIGARVDLVVALEQLHLDGIMRGHKDGNDLKFIKAKPVGNPDDKGIGRPRTVGLVGKARRSGTSPRDLGKTVLVLGGGGKRPDHGVPVEIGGENGGQVHGFGIARGVEGEGNLLGALNKWGPVLSVDHEEGIGGGVPARGIGHDEGDRVAPALDSVRGSTLQKSGSARLVQVGDPQPKATRTLGQPDDLDLAFVAIRV